MCVSIYNGEGNLCGDTTHRDCSGMVVGAAVVMMMPILVLLVLGMMAARSGSDDGGVCCGVSVGANENDEWRQ